MYVCAYVCARTQTRSLQILFGIKIKSDKKIEQKHDKMKRKHNGVTRYILEKFFPPGHIYVRDIRSSIYVYGNTRRDPFGLT